MRNRFFIGGNLDDKKVIKGIHGPDGGIESGRFVKSNQSPWNAILHSVSHLQTKGIDLLCACKRVLGDGKSIKFWDEIWSGDRSYRVMFPRVYALDENKSDVVLSDSRDEWKWTLDSKGFSVTSACTHIDEHILNGFPMSIRWSGCVPIKVNVFMWRLRLDKLPTLMNMDRKGIDVDSFCAPWCDLDIPELHNIAKWLSWVDDCQVSKKARLVLEGVVATMMWSLWNFRNTLIFLDSKPKKATIWDSIVYQSFVWISSRNPKFLLSWIEGYDCTGRKSIGPILKCTSAIRQLAYGTAADAFNEYLQIGERTQRRCLVEFTKCVHILYVEKYLRKPTLVDIENLHALHEEKHGLPGMLGSIDCMHWDWKNCPKALAAQFKRRDHKYPTIMLEAVADQRLWIWHAYFGVPGANNDLNVLYGSPLFDDELAGTAPECPFEVNGHIYNKGYYLADGIYPTWSVFVKTFSVAKTEKTLKFKRIQESSRKDIERAFGVLQGRWGIIRQPARAFEINALKRIMYCCVMLHNMILEDEDFVVNLRDVFVDPTPDIPQEWTERCDLHVRKHKELRDSKVHNDLRDDLVSGAVGKKCCPLEKSADVAALFPNGTTVPSALRTCGIHINDTTPGFAEWCLHATPPPDTRLGLDRLSTIPRHQEQYAATIAQTLDGSARGWFERLPHDSINEWADLREAFAARFSVRRACFKEPYEITKIIRKANESLTTFKERWTVETGFIMGVPEVMKIMSFMDSVKSPDLAKRFLDKVPTMVNEMMERDTRPFRDTRPVESLRDKYKNNYRGRDAYRATRARDDSAPYPYPRGEYNRRAAPVLTLDSLTKYPKEILATETQQRLSVPRPMLNPLRSGNTDRHCDYHQENGHYTNDCIQLRK
ncbi:ALP1-like protein [Tanacetum coccineum]